MLDPKPQSIIHQAVRLERKIVRTVKKTASVRSLLKRKDKTTKNTKQEIEKHVDDQEGGSECCQRQPDRRQAMRLAMGKAMSSRSLLNRKDNNVNKKGGGLNCPPVDFISFPESEDEEYDDKWETTSSTQNLSVEDGTFNSSVLSFGDFSMTEHDLEYRTVERDEILMVNCFRSGTCFIHFFDTENETSSAIDQEMKKLAASIQSTSVYVRIHKSNAPCLADRLHSTDIDVPTVVALKNGEEVGRVSEFQSLECVDWAEWVSSLEM